ncbi:hypothetical protein [uncultured Roseovarius sp.]|uniref:hypothetical protein n=1 Tax=uncultured Roseovarius sp. TaxID=293344 RepID=UPI0025970709|nr:hypothetical protein [uncultured Roseovarius sp.]MDW3119384.1 hypothetical protein [Roseovarius pacificus]
MHITPDPNLARARQIVTDPAAHAENPALRCEAWATLKRARGQTVSMARIRPITPTEPTLAQTLDQTIPGVRARIRAHMAKLGGGYSGPEDAA